MHGVLEHSVPQGKAYFIPARQTGGALGSVSLHTFTHTKWALLTLLGRRQVILPHCAIPLWSDCHSILPFGKQPGWYYKSILQTAICQALAHEEQRHVHVSVHTHVTCRMRVGMDAQLFSIDEVRLFQTQVLSPLCDAQACHN